jgi:1-acyl-sn-glycerol-3-phosphate acyltransferase
MPVRRTLARTLIRAARWKLSGDVPRTGILIGAPHTSAWDWLVMLISHTYFTGVRGSILRRTGGVPLDRGNPGATIRALLEEAAGGEPFLLVIAPEGTRGKEEYWKPGFYRISGQTGLPIGLGFVDGPSRTLGIGPTLVPSGDVKADMDLVRAFYADKRGIRPENRTEPRLREETADPGEAKKP